MKSFGNLFILNYLALNNKTKIFTFVAILLLGFFK